MVQWLKGCSIAAAVAQVTAVALIQSLAQELPYATVTVLKNKPKKKVYSTLLNCPSEMLTQLFVPQ